MFKNQPKGLLTAAFSNMGERFGFYTMMAILTLFLSAKFGLTDVQAGWIYSTFYALIYILALAGGFIADRTKNYKGTIMTGIVTMSIGYVIIAIPTPTPVPNLPLYLILTCIGLFVIAFGNGLFKGNLQAVVGQMYDNDQYRDKRDSGFSIFYMFINVGAIFAPFLAIIVRNWWLGTKGFTYNADLPTLCHEFLGKTITPEASARFTELATEVSTSGAVTDLTVFANSYLDAFATGFHYAFATAIVAMAISLVIYIVNQKSMPDPRLKVIQATDSNEAPVAQMDVKEIKQRLYALFAVFGVVIFFWFSFHQNGLTLTYFARDYVNLSNIVIPLGFTEIKGAEIFQSLNPLFVVFLTPIILGIFGWMKTKKIELSTPSKIAVGMGIAALAYVVMAVGSIGVPTMAEVTAQGGLPDVARVTPWLLIGTYFILTVAELFISPLGLSFVSKVAPPHLQGLMQGCWLGATAVGNQLLFIGALFYESLPIWATWALFVVACSISMIAMLSMIKWLDRITSKAV